MKKYILIPAIFLLFQAFSVTAEPLRMGNLANFWAIQPAIVKAKGWDREEGLEIEYLKFPGPSGLLQAFAGGKLDAMNNNLAASLLVLNKGKRFKLISSLIHGDITLIGKTAFSEDLKHQDMLSALKTYKDKLGHSPRIVTNSYGSLSQIQISQWFKTKCPECPGYVDMQYAADPTQAQQIYLSGNAEFISAFEPYSSIILSKTSDSSVVLHASELQSKQPGSALAVSSEYLERNPQNAEKLRKLWMRATEFVKINPKESVDIIDREITAGLIDKEILTKALSNITPYLMEDPNQSIQLMLDLKQFMCQENYLSCQIEIEDLSLDFSRSGEEIQRQHG